MAMTWRWWSGCVLTVWVFCRLLAHRIVDTALATLANMCEDVGDGLDSDALGRPLNLIVRARP